MLRPLSSRIVLSLLGGLVKGRHLAKSDLFEDVYKILSKPKGLVSANTALGVMLAGGLRTGEAIYRKPGVQASIDSMIQKVFWSQAEYTEEPEEVDKQADEIVALFRSKHIHPIYLAVDGVPGSGKSTLSRVLARKLKMNYVCLDNTNLDIPIRFDPRETIYEHHRLLRTQDIDRFDAIIYLDEPVSRSKSKVLRRKRGGILVDIMDFDLLKRVGEKAFSVANGKTYEIPHSYIKVKIRPPGGYESYNNLLKELRHLGRDLSDLSKEELLFLSTDNRARKGFFAYVNAGAYNKEILAGLAEGLYQITMRTRM